MEFKSETQEQLSHKSHNSFSKAVIFSSIAGPDDQNVVIDLALSDEISAEAKRVNLKGSVKPREIEEVQKIWAKTRSDLSGISLINGWHYLGSQETQSLNNEANNNTNIENSLDTNLEHPVEQNTVSENKIGIELKNLLNETLEVFTSNAGAFQEHLGDLKKEVQTLPLFQGALNALSNSVINQKEEINDLKGVCDFGLSSLIQEQNNVKEDITRILSSLTTLSKKEVSALPSGPIKELQELVKKNNYIEMESLRKLEDNLKLLDLSLIQGSLETLYKVNKKGIEESREVLIRLMQTISEIDTKTDNIISEDMIINLQEEVKMHLSAILRIERKFESFRNKAVLAYSFAIGVLGVLLGACLNLF